MSKIVLVRQPEEILLLACRQVDYLRPIIYKNNQIINKFQTRKWFKKKKKKKTSSSRPLLKRCFTTTLIIMNDRIVGLLITKK